MKVATFSCGKIRITKVVLGAHRLILHRLLRQPEVAIEETHQVQETRKKIGLQIKEIKARRTQTGLLTMAVKTSCVIVANQLKSMICLC